MTPLHFRQWHISAADQRSIVLFHVEVWLRTIRWFWAVRGDESARRALDSPGFQAFFEKMGIPPP